MFSKISDKSGKCLDKSGKCLGNVWTSLGNVLLKNKRFSADGQNIAQNCTAMRVVPCGHNEVLGCSQPPEEDLRPIHREEVEIAVASLETGSAGVDNIPAELI